MFRVSDWCNVTLTWIKTLCCSWPMPLPTIAYLVLQICNKLTAFIPMYAIYLVDAVDYTQQLYLCWDNKVSVQVWAWWRGRQWNGECLPSHGLVSLGEAIWRSGSSLSYWISSISAVLYRYLFHRRRIHNILFFFLTKQSNTAKESRGKEENGRFYSWIVLPYWFEEWGMHYT